MSDKRAAIDLIRNMIDNDQFNECYALAETQSQKRLLNGLFSKHHWGRRKFQEMNNPIVHAVSRAAWRLMPEKTLNFQDWYNNKFVYRVDR